MATDSLEQRTSHGKRKNPSDDTGPEPDQDGSEGSLAALHSATAPSVVSVPRASTSTHQRRRRRQPREGHGSEDFAATPSEGIPHDQPQSSGEGATSFPGQGVPSAVPGESPGGSSCPTCWLCRGPAASGRVVELVAHDRGPAVSPDSGGWMPDLSGNFGTNTQDIPSYSLEPMGQPMAAWESTNTNLAEFQAPRSPVGWAGTEQGNGSSVAWPGDAYGGFGNASPYTGFPGPSVPSTPASGGVGSHAESMGGYGCHPAGGQGSMLPTPFGGEVPGGDGGFMGPIDPFLSGMNPESLDARRMGGN